MKNSETKTRKAPIELSIEYQVKEWRDEAKEVRIRTAVERDLAKSTKPPTPPPPPTKLTTELNQVRMKAIHQWLKENKYIDVDVDSWLYWFDLQAWINKKKNPAKIKWIGAVYHLTNVVFMLCGNMNKQTETAMKNTFQLPNGRKFQKMTAENIQRDKEPYKSLYNMIKFSDRNIKNLN